MTTTPLERLRAAAGGSAPLVPVAGSLGITVDSVDEGRMVATLAPSPAVLRGPGPAFVMIDMVLSAVVATVLPSDHAISTLTLHWAGTRPFPDPAGPLVATGSVVHLTQDSALSTGELTDADGEVVATVTNRSALLPLPPGGRGGGRAQQPDPVGFAALGLTGGPSRWTGVSAPALSNTAGALQGGVVAAVATHALDAAVAAARPELAGATFDLDVTYLRGIPSDGSGFAVAAQPLHAGRRLAAARAELHDSAGRLAILASSAHWRGR
ncbi:PaaI family thioesterase [Pseudonocardia lacus]|uniref:PaaI family thioesterase n=1 Tax=Pseudonocardia lacus TaxID=2835865 RepID=UPI001BDBB2CA|nr:PaaI family thioesterase [Pseudonocardia lacus]